MGTEEPPKRDRHPDLGRFQPLWSDADVKMFAAMIKMIDSTQVGLPERVGTKRSYLFFA